MKVVAGIGQNRAVAEAAREVDFDVILTESEAELVQMLLNGEVDAAIRGSLSASKILTLLRQKYPKLSRASFLEIKGHKFLLTPVGIDEGKGVEEKVHLIESGVKFLEDIHIKPKVAVLSAGRAQDKDRSQRIHDSIKEGEIVTAITRDKYPVKHYFILIEDAVADDANLILAPDGISGNLIFRSLVLVGGVKSHGAVTLGMDEIFVDTSRSQKKEGYVRALEFAAYLAGMKKLKNEGQYPEV